MIIVNPYVIARVIVAPTIFAVGSLATNGTTSSPVNVTWPAGVAADDIAILQLCINDSASTNSLNTPSGWTLIDLEQVGGFDSATHGLFWKRCAGDETGSFTVTTTAGHAGSDSFGAIVTLIRGCVTTGDPFEGLAVAAAFDANMQGAAVTTLGAARLVCHFGDTYSQATATPASGWAEDYDLASNTGSVGLGVKLYSKVRSTAGVEAAATHVLSTSRRWQTMALAFIPA